MHRKDAREVEEKLVPRHSYGEIENGMTVDGFSRTLTAMVQTS